MISSITPISCALGAATGSPFTIIWKRVGHTGEARQPLGSAGTGQDAELDFGLADLGRWDCAAVVETHCGFEAAAEGSAVDRGHRELGRILDRKDHLGEGRALRRFAKLADIGSCMERAAGTDEHDGLGAVVSVRLGEPLLEPRPHRVRQRIDWRAVDGDHPDSALRS